MRSRSLLAVLLAVPALTLPTAAPASAAAPGGSIVYVHDDDVWLARGDGSGQYQVTFDGTPDTPYTSPSQSDTGVIVVGHGPHLIRMTQNGTVLNRLDPGPLTNSVSHPVDGPIIHAAVSPDGQLAAYTLGGWECPIGVSCGYRTVTAITRTDRLTPPSTYGTTFLEAPSWVGNARTLQSGGFLEQINLADLGRPAVHWFDDQDVAEPSTDLGDAELSPDGRWLAAVRGYDESTHITWYAVAGDARSGPVPAAPDWICQTGELAGLADPTWSPDSTTMAWQEPDGIWVKSDPSDCEVPQPRLLIAGGSEPDWSAAPLAPAARSFTVTKRPAVAGAARVGKRLQARAGGWSPAPRSVRYQWLRNGRAIRKATRPSYRLVRADVRRRISVRVTVSAPGRADATATSAASKPVKKPVKKKRR